MTVTVKVIIAGHTYNCFYISKESLLEIVFIISLHTLLSTIQIE